MAARGFFFFVKPSTISCHSYYCCWLLFRYKVYLDFPTRTLFVSQHCFVHSTASVKVEPLLPEDSVRQRLQRGHVRETLSQPCAGRVLAAPPSRATCGSGGAWRTTSLSPCVVKAAFSPPGLLMRRLFNDHFFVGNFSFFCGFF